MATKNRAALFARYSSKLQDELSLEAQLEEMERFCEREGLHITHRFLLPETRSALVEKSEEFLSMIRAARRGEFDALIVHKLDRFTRSRDTAVTYKALLRRHGVQVRSVTENLGDSIYDRLIEGILEAFNEFYSLNLAEETKKGQRAATRAGRWTGGTFPYGYRKGEDDQGHPCYEIDPDPAEVMATCFQLYADGHRTGEILDWVEERTGERWSLPTLKNRLANPVYHGRLLYGKTRLDARGNRTKQDRDNLTEGEVPPIISQELFEQCRAIAQRNKKGRARRPVYPYLLTEGVMYCADCGRPVVGALGGGTNQYPYYRCSGWRDKKCKRQRAARADLLDELIKTQLIETAKLIRPDDFEPQYLQEEDARNAAIEKLEKQITDRLRTLEKEQENFLGFIASGNASTTVAKRLAELEAEESELKVKLASFRAAEERRLEAEQRIVTDYIDRMVGYLQEDPARPEWREAVRALFRLDWDFKTKTGRLMQADPFENLSEMPKSWKLDFRSARNSQITTFLEIKLAGTKLIS